MNPNKATKKTVKKASEQNVMPRSLLRQLLLKGKSSEKNCNCQDCCETKRMKQTFQLQSPQQGELALIEGRLPRRAVPRTGQEGKVLGKSSECAKVSEDFEIRPARTRWPQQKSIREEIRKGKGRAVSDKSTGVKRRRRHRRPSQRKHQGRLRARPKDRFSKASFPAGNRLLPKTEKKTEKTAAGKPKETEKKEKPVKTSPKKTPSRSRTKTIEKDMKGAAAKVAALLKKPAREKTAADKKKKEAMMTEKPAAPKTSARKTAPEL